MKRLIPIFTALILMSLLAVPEPVQAQYTPFKIQFGIWQEPPTDNHYRERVGPKTLISGGPGTVVNANLGSPSSGSWWEVVP